MFKLWCWPMSFEVFLMTESCKRASWRFGPNVMIKHMVVLGLLVFSFPGAAAAAQVETNYYSIFGADYSELSQQMAQKGPQGFAGYTASSISYNYRTTPQGASCRIAKVDFDYSLIYTMPKWENAESADPALQGWWQEYYAALWRHEQNHGRIADQRYSAIQRAFSSLGARPTCAEFGPLLREQYTLIDTEFDARQAEYDRETQHGLTEMPSFMGSSVSLNSVNQIPQGSFLQRQWLWLLLGGFVGFVVLKR